MFEETFQLIGDAYQADFSDSADWLKIGLHSHARDERYDEFTVYQTGKSDWNQFVETVIQVTGTTETTDKFPRLHYYSGSKECLWGMNEAESGAVVFLAADDDRISYYLSSDENLIIQTNDSYYDDETGLVFLKTDMRGDWFSEDFKSKNIYDKPIKKDVYKELERRFSSEKYTDQIKTYIWFCHEWQVYDGESINKNIEWIEDVCKFANDYNIPFDYPQNKLERYYN